MPNTLPELDLAPFMAAPDSAAGRELVARLRDACHGPGFCYLVGHGVPPELDAAVMAVAREFFALPEAERRALAIARSPHFRGYTVLGDERTKGESDWREQLDVGPRSRPPSSRATIRRGGACAGRTSGPHAYPRCSRPCSRGCARWIASGSPCCARSRSASANRSTTSTASCCRAAIRT